MESGRWVVTTVSWTERRQVGTIHEEIEPTFQSSRDSLNDIVNILVLAFHLFSS